METKRKHLNELHFDHQLWLSEAIFYGYELSVYRKRLESISFRNTAQEIKKQIEHFQNQFIIQKEQLDLLNHETVVHEQWLAQVAKENPIASDHRLFADHQATHEKINAFKKIYNDLKAEFIRFLSERL